MAIEAEMRALTEALNKHTDALNNFVKGAGKAGAGASAESGSKPSGTKPSGTKPSGPKKIKLEDVQKKFGEYLNTTDKKERAARVEVVKKLNEHFDTAKMTEADPSVWPDAFAILDRVIEGEDIDDVLAEFGGDAGDEGEGDSVV